MDLSNLLIKTLRNTPKVTSKRKLFPVKDLVILELLGYIIPHISTNGILVEIGGKSNSPLSHGSPIGYDVCTLGMKSRRLVLNL